MKERMVRKKMAGTLAVVGALGFSVAAGVPEGAAAAPLRPISVASPVKALSPIRLEVDISERKLYIYHGGELRNTLDVAVGEPDHPTPKGEFTINRLIWNPAWVPPPNAEWADDETKKAPNDPENPMVGAKLFFEYPDYYIHGTDALHTLGTAASHGCIRMNPVDVMNLAELVQEHGGKSRSDAWYERVQRDDSDKHEVTLSDPIPVEIRP